MSVWFNENLKNNIVGMKRQGRDSPISDSVSVRFKEYLKNMVEMKRGSVSLSPIRIVITFLMF